MYVLQDKVRFFRGAGVGVDILYLLPRACVCVREKRGESTINKRQRPRYKKPRIRSRQHIGYGNGTEGGNGVR
jgi:hypothetical protein